MKRFLVLFMALLSILISSCITYDEEIKINPDLSGTMTMAITIPNLLLQGDNEEENLQDIFKDLKEKIKKSKNVQLIESKEEPLGNATRYKIKIKFTSIEALKKVMNDNSNDNNYGSIYNFSIKKSGDKIIFERVLNVATKENKKKEPTDELAENFLAMSLSNFIWTFKTTFPYEVLETNGVLSEDKKTVVWKYDLYTLTKKDVKMEAVLQEPSLIEKIIIFIKSIIK